MTTLTVTFEQARREASLRQQYLDSLLKEATDSISAFIYDSDGSKREAHLQQLVIEGYVKQEELQPRLENGRKSDFYFVTTVSRELIGSGKKSPIFVYDKAFQKLGVENLFLNSVLDHEGKHADDIKKGISLRDGIVITPANIGLLQEVTAINLIEATAYRRQLERAAGRGITRNDYLSYISFLHDGHITALFRISAQNEFERQMISECLK